MADQADPWELGVASLKSLNFSFNARVERHNKDRSYEDIVQIRSDVFAIAFDHGQDRKYNVTDLVVFKLHPPLQRGNCDASTLYAQRRFCIPASVHTGRESFCWRRPKHGLNGSTAEWKKSKRFFLWSRTNLSSSRYCEECMDIADHSSLSRALACWGLSGINTFGHLPSGSLELHSGINFVFRISQFRFDDISKKLISQMVMFLVFLRTVVYEAEREHVRI